MSDRLLKNMTVVSLILVALLVILINFRTTVLGVYSLGDISAKPAYDAYARAPEVLLMTWGSIAVIIVYAIYKWWYAQKK